MLGLASCRFDDTSPLAQDNETWLVASCPRCCTVALVRGMDRVACAIEPRATTADLKHVGKHGPPRFPFGGTSVHHFASVGRLSARISRSRTGPNLKSPHKYLAFVQVYPLFSANKEALRARGPARSSRVAKSFSPARSARSRAERLGVFGRRRTLRAAFRRGSRSWALPADIDRSSPCHCLPLLPLSPSLKCWCAMQMASTVWRM